MKTWKRTWYDKISLHVLLKSNQPSHNLTQSTIPAFFKLVFFHHRGVLVFQAKYLGLSGGITKKNVWRGANGKQVFEPPALKSVVIGKFAFKDTAWGREA
jgi:hypothetical protein